MELKNIMNSNRYRPITIIFLLVFLSGCASSQIPISKWNPAKTTHTIDSNPNLKFLWERSIYTEPDEYGAPCIAMNGMLFVIGSEYIEGNVKMIAIDGQNGKTKWSKDSDVSFANSEDQLFIGNKQTIFSLSTSDGHQNWRTYLPQARSIGELFYYDNKIFVSASGYPFFVISPKDGAVLADYSSSDHYRQDYADVPFYPDINFRPILIGDDIILHSGKITYSLRKENRTTHTVIWEIENELISNSTLIDGTIYYISKDDKLIARSADTDDLLDQTPIQPSFEFFNLEKNVQHDGYYVCGDAENGLLYIILGDSRQLFAFSVNK